MSLHTQYLLLFYSLIIGIYIGVTYDLLYYFILMHLKKAVIFICDLLFFIIQGFIVFQVIYNVNDGIIPFYSYLIIGIGFMVYYNSSQSYYKRQLYPLKKLIKYGYKKIIKLLKYIFVKPFVDSYLFFEKIYLFIKRKSIKVFKFIKSKWFKPKKKQVSESNSQNSTEL